MQGNRSIESIEIGMIAGRIGGCGVLVEMEGCCGWCGKNEGVDGESGPIYVMLGDAWEADIDSAMIM